MLPHGEPVKAVTLRNRRGMSARLITCGASLQSLFAPDRQGNFADMTLGHATLAEYLSQRQYFGATVGRVANRIAGGRFSLDGRGHHVPANDGPNALHGGVHGFDRANWRVEEVGDQRVVLSHLSPDGDQGFPGTLSVTATYTLNDDNALALEYRATADRSTLVNLSNHAYWNLAGEGAPGGAMGHVLTIPADHYLPVDEGLIPTGEFRPVDGQLYT